MDSKDDVSIQKKLALALEKAKAKLLHYNEPIAIIGMSCTFPGAPNLDAFWNLLHQGQDGIQDIPASRWNIQDYYDSDPNAPGKMITKKGGFIQDIEKFDAFFFNISPREAEALDPQQRLLLEQTWYALEHAGIAALDLRGSDTGVFVGIATQDYRDLIIEQGDLRNINAYFGSGNALSTATGRLSYTLGLQGPNMAIETACSSSLVALHEACTSLQRGECTLAIAGGVNALLAPGLFVNFSKAGMLSPDGCCKTFDEKANGYVRGEGCGILILKRLSEALQDNDTILAVVKASGINQDGASSGLTVPNGEAQEKLLKRVLSESKLKASDIDYIECHGTGTSLGDPIEVHALGEVYGLDRTPEKPLFIGSVKTNIGHLEAAAGVAGLIKSVLALQHQELPKNLHFQTLNPHIELNFPGTILTKNTQWQSHEAPRRAAVSAFGFSGTNAHVILEEAPTVSAVKSEEGDWVLGVSAKTPSALSQLIQDYIIYLEANPTLCIQDFIYTANTGRSLFEHQARFSASSVEELLAHLKKNNRTSLDLKTPQHGNKIALPTYPFEKESYWITTNKSISNLNLSASRALSAHPFLGLEFDSPKSDRRIFESLLSAQKTPLLMDHVFYGTPIFAFAAYLSTVIEALRSVRSDTVLRFTDVTVETPLLFKANETRLVQTIILSKDGEDEFSFSMQSREEQDLSHQWRSHIAGKGAYLQDALRDEDTVLSIDVSALKEQADSKLSGVDLYQQIQDLDIYLGSGFQWLDTCFIGHNNGNPYVLAELKIPSLSYMGEAYRQAGYLDAAFVLGAGRCLQNGFEAVCVPISMNQYSLSSSGMGLWVYVELLNQGLETHHCDIKWCQEDGRVVDWINNMQFRSAPKAKLLQSLHHSMPIDEELFVIAWQPYKPVKSDILPDRVLYLSQGHEETVLLNTSISCLHVSLEDSWQILNSTKISLDKSLLSDYERLLKDFATSKSLLVYDGLSLESMKPEINGLLSLLSLIQALIKLDGSEAPTLIVLSCNAYSINGHPNAPAASAINGLLTSVLAEYPFLKIRQVDIESEVLLENHMASLFAGDSNTVHVWRGADCYVPRLRSLNQIQSKPSEPELKTNPLLIEREGFYLITGGLGGLGLLLTEYLLSQQVKHICLTARHEASAEVTLHLQELAASHGARISTQVLDVSNQVMVNDFIANLSQLKTSLSGIFHLAGVLDDASIPEQRLERLEHVLSGKAFGAYYLHEATKQSQTPIVFFSSIAALLGSAGQTNYAIANAYLDSLAAYRMSQGLVSISIAWGPWADVGMASLLQSVMHKNGFGMLDKIAAFDLLDVALRTGYSHIGAAVINWEQFARARLKVSLFLQELVADDISDKGPLYLLLQKAQHAERLNLLINALTEMFRETLGFKAHMQINQEEGFFNLGMDSIMAVALRNKVQLAIGAKHAITVADIFNYSDIKQLSTFLVKKMRLLEENTGETKAVLKTTISDNEPIAIIGMGCRYPGGANSPEAFWELLKEGYDGISDIPKDRWNVDDYYSTDKEAPGKLTPRKGGFLNFPVADFDAGFFRIAPRQAKMTDPMHRLLLEVSWEALEDAGIAPSSLKNTETGVYVGVWHSDYADLIMQNYGKAGINSFTNFTTLSAASGILSFFYGLKGPSYSVDTACSSSLVALDGAVKGLQSGECDIAIVAGSNLILTPDASIGFDKAGMLSPDSSCKTFDESANGYVRSEGIGVIIVKRLNDAMRDNDKIYGVIKGIRVNHNGPASGLTVPNGLAQQELILHTLAASNLKPQDVDYVECHGTGTALGDPIEVGAINEVFAHSHTKSKPLYLGSVKSNIGHLEATAGLAGIMKVLLAMKHDLIPPNIHFQKLNPKMSIDAMPAQVVTNLTPWGLENKIKIAGVNSFGATGINAHVILEEAPIKTIDIKELELPEACLFVVSAKTESALQTLLLHYIDYLEHTEDSLFNICYTSSTGREHFQFRMAYIVSDKKELVSRLQFNDQPFMEVNLSSELVTTGDLLLQQQAFLEGKSIDFKGYYAPYKNALSKVMLPSYCFDKQKYWIDLSVEKTTSLKEDFYQIQWQELPPHLKVEDQEVCLILVSQSDKSKIADLSKAHLYYDLDAFDATSLSVFLKDHQNVPVLWIVEERDVFVEDLKTLYQTIYQISQLILQHSGGVTVVTVMGESVLKEEQASPFMSSIRGLIRTLYLESAGIRIQLLDVDHLDNAWIAYVDCQDNSEKAIRKQAVYQRRLALGTLSVPEVAWEESGRILVTGGLGALGLQVIQSLVEKGVKHFSLLSRRQPSEAAASKIRSWITQGIEIDIAAIDVADLIGLKAYIDKINHSITPLKGVIHAAGVLQDGMFESLSFDDFIKPLSPKIQGVINLHLATQSCSLTHFILFSSIAGILGSPGQSNYALANAFLDGFASMRIAQGLPATSINWGAWAGSGMASQGDIRRTQNGMMSLEPKKALVAFDEVFFHPVYQTTIAEFDWKQIAHQPILKDLPLFKNLLPKVQKQAYPRLLMLQGEEGTQRRAAIKSILLELCSQILGFEEKNIQSDVGFFNLGMDSLMAMDLRNKLQQEIGTLELLSSSLALDYPSVDKLTDYLDELLSQQKKATEVITLEHYQQEAIAVIGMHGIFPGDCNSLEALWHLLESGQSGIVAVPESRWDMDEYYDADKDKPGKMYVKKGGFIQGIESFDAEFFNILPREASLIDPQQRLVLECGWHALEDAGINPETLGGHPVGVMIGASQAEYGYGILESQNSEHLTPYTATGAALSAISGRLAYALDLQGPSMTIDTACSSSLIAIHNACDALRNGEAELMIAGGVNLTLNPHINVSLCRSKMLSEDGACKTFDKNANGYVRSEGCALVILKRLSDALKDQDRIYGTILASTINQDGASGGLTVPNKLAQERLLKHTLAKAQLKADEVSYIEAHGTGTALGDPIEIGAITAVYGDRDNEHPLVISAIKSNIGHLEAAAGVAGLIKVLLSFQYGKIPGVCHFKQLNPKIDLKQKPIIISSQSQQWPLNSEPYAAVSAFGFTGMNAHAILKAPEKNWSVRQALILPESYLFVLSAKSEHSLKELIASYVSYLKTSQESLADICYTAAVGRKHWNWRVAWVVTNKKELLKQLQSVQLLKSVDRASGEKVCIEDLEAQAKAYLEGKSIDFNAYYVTYQSGLKKVSLPLYPFDKKHYWVSAQKRSELSESRPGHPFLKNESFDYRNGSYLFTTRLRKNVPDFISHHQIFGELVIAGADYISAVMSFVIQILKRDSGVIESFEFIQPLVLAQDESRDFQISAVKEGNYYLIDIYSLPTHLKQNVIMHAQAKISLDKEYQIQYLDIAELKKPLSQVYEVKQHQAQAQKRGLKLKHHFLWLKELFYDENTIVAEMRSPHDDEREGYDYYPGLVDASFQSGLVWLSNQDELEIPLSVKSIHFGQGRMKWVYIKRSQNNEQDLYYLDEKGLVLAHLSSFKTRLAPESVLKKMFAIQTNQPSLIYQEIYEPFLPEWRLPVEQLNEWFIHSENHSIIESINASFHVTAIQTDELQSLEGQHVLFVYEDNFNTLVDFCKKIKDLKVKSMTLWVKQAYALEKGAPVNPEHRQAVGFWKSFCLESGFSHYYLIDTEQVTSIPQYCSAIDQDLIKEPVLIEQNGYFVPRLVRLDEMKEIKPFSYKKDASYLITGGTGGLGKELAEHIIQAGGMHIALISRSKPDKPIQLWIEAHRSKGIDLQHYSVDVSDKAALEQVFEQIKENQAPLKGIFHAAGVLRDKLFDNLTKDDFQKVLEPKVTGSRHLHELSQHLALDCFVLFSSIASNMGNVGQSNYAAANAFLDGLALMRASLGLPALSIHWGPFGSLGMAAQLGTLNSAKGVNFLETNKAYQVMDQIMNSSFTEISIASMNWDSMPDQQDPYFNKLISVKEQKKGLLIDLLQHSPPEKRELILIDKLKEIVAEVLAITNKETIDNNAGFFDLGMDSIMAVEVNNQLKRLVGSEIDISSTFIFNNPSIDAIYDYLREHLVVFNKTESPIKKSEEPLVNISSDEKRALAMKFLKDDFGEN